MGIVGVVNKCVKSREKGTYFFLKECGILSAAVGCVNECKYDEKKIWRLS